MKGLVKFADIRKDESLANSFRRKRFAHFEKIAGRFSTPVRILDIGGTGEFWDMLGVNPGKYRITILNVYPENEFRNEHYEYIQGDAAELSVPEEKKFDIIFSNSVIEHICGEEKRRKMAERIRNSGAGYYIQTPNYYFPMEPHFLFPFFQFLHQSLKVFLVRNFRLGWYERCRDREEAVHLVSSVRLLKAKELRALFPDAEIYRERFFGITKSLTAYRI